MELYGDLIEGAGQSLVIDFSMIIVRKAQSQRNLRNN
jgi:hypothetical protein